MKALSSSATVSINELVTKKKTSGERIYNFAAGDPVLRNHPSITRRAVQQAEKGFCPYPPVEGVPELRTLTAQWINAGSAAQYSKENVLVTCGGKFAIFSIIYTLVQPHEEVLIPSPYWVSYPEIVRMAGGTPVVVPCSSDGSWKVTAADLVKHLTEKSKFLIFNNACNPTGVLYSRQEVEEILTFAKKYGLTVISDEVYSGLAYEAPGFVSCGSFPEYRERVLIVQSCSKNFGMTGWRVGFVLGPAEVISKLAVLQTQSTTGVSLISQWAAVGALENADEVNAYVNSAMRKRRDLFFNTFRSLFPGPVAPVQSALYAFVPLSSMGIHHTRDSVAVAERLMVADNIALIPGKAFGLEGYVRFTFADVEENIEQGLRALRQAIERLGSVHE